MLDPISAVSLEAVDMACLYLRRDRSTNLLSVLRLHIGIVLLETTNAHLALACAPIVVAIEEVCVKLDPIQAVCVDIPPALESQVVTTKSNNYVGSARDCPSERSQEASGFTTGELHSSARGGEAGGRWGLSSIAESI